LQGGREVDGVLKGFDKLDNLVLDDCVEYVKGKKIAVSFPAQANYLCLDPQDPYRVTETTRKLGLIVCRGLQVSLLCPSDGIEEIANPFEDAGEGDDVAVN
jgi:U6 snRNA-associated Sm-like protein LSm7